MKNIILFLLSFCLILSFVGCNKQPSVESSSEVTTTSEEITVTTSESTQTASEQTTTTSTNTSTSKPQPPSSSKPVTTTSKTSTATTSKVSSVPTYSGTYLDDMTPAELTFSYNSLKSKLSQHIAGKSPTSTSGNYKTYNISANYKDFNILGYPADQVTTVELNVTTDAESQMKSVSYIITMAYKSAETVEQLVIRDMNKLFEFTDNAEINYFLNREFGNPDEFTSFEELNAAENTRKMYKGQRDNSFINIQYLNADKSIKTTLIVGTTNQNGILKTTVKVQINY